MKSVNDVLMKFFKLPPAVQMMLALLGFGSLATLVFAILPILKTTRGKIIAVIIVGVGLAIFGIIWLIRRMLSGKKSSQLGSALGSQGPTRGDIAEQEQIYREKFRAKLAELKTNGLSVYKLPWFVLMGEPGCGKTSTLTNSGLDFPLGRDEVPGFGGTRNYNWWFTNEAVILDTAGRIAFQEEGTTDKVEWEYFLKLLKGNRPRCPINGVIIALPADKLLRDTPDERMAKAAVLRERLRQIHQTLGVRFPTFVLVTKMDLVGGFSEFFEEIRVDLQQRNQMFGWSRPGEFQEAYEPSGFRDAFDSVHGRLRDWAMRYLQRKATDDELGMIVTFPEAFRELGKPLDDFIGTIFQKSPLVEPPFFRGFYFTSAVQEGAPIFSVFSRGRSGVTISERAPKAADSKAFFIHDFYDKKVFPESGLVFRSAKAVSLNKRMRRLVWYGGSAVVLLLGTLFFLGSYKVKSLVEDPQKDCEEAKKVILAEQGARGAKFSDLAENVRLAQQLRAHYDKFAGTSGWYARLLFIGANLNEPRSAVEQIHANFVARAIIKPTLEQVGAKLNEVNRDTLKDATGRESFLSALGAYTKWYGHYVGQENQKPITRTEAEQRAKDFERMLAFLGGAKTGAEAAEQVRLALEELEPARVRFAIEVLGKLGLDRDAMTAAVKKGATEIAAYWEPRIDLKADNTDPRLRYWLGFVAAVQNLRSRYDAILALGPRFEAASKAGSGGEANALQDFIAAGEEYKKLTTGLEKIDDFELSELPDTFAGAFKALHAYLKNNQTSLPYVKEKNTIQRLRDVRGAIASLWQQDFKVLTDALGDGAPEPTAQAGSPQYTVYAEIRQSSDRLSKRLDDQLKDVLEKLNVPAGEDPLDYYAKMNLIEFEESRDGAPRAEPPVVRLHSQALGPGKEVKTYLKEILDAASPVENLVAQLKDFSTWPALLSDVAADPNASRGLARIIAVVKAKVAAESLSEENRRTTIRRTMEGVSEFWRPVELFDFASLIWRGKELTGRSFLIGEMAKAASATLSGDLRGLGRLVPGFDQPKVDALPFEYHKFNQVAARPAEPAVPQPEAKPADDDGLRTRTPPRATTAAAEGQLAPESGEMILATYHSREFLARTLRTYMTTRDALEKIGGTKQLVSALDEAAAAYVNGYYTDWNRVYTRPTLFFDEKTLALLERCRDGKEMDWPTFQKEIGDRGDELARRVAARLNALVREAVLTAFELDGAKELDKRVWTFIRQEGVQTRTASVFLPTQLKPFVDALPREDFGDTTYGTTLTQAFADYARQVKALEAGPKPRTPLPNLAALSQRIIYAKDVDPERFVPARALTDLAGYGNRLLTQHLDQKLTDLFKDRAGKFPLVADLTDTSPNRARLERLATEALTAEEFVGFLRAAARFNDEYGGMLKELHPEESHVTRATLARCQKWIDFLYGTDKANLNDRLPPPIPLQLAIAKAVGSGVTDAGAGYTEAEINLPILNKSGREISEPFRKDPRDPDLISIDAFDGLAGDRKLEKAWSLERREYPTVVAKVSKRFGGVDASKFPDPMATSWSLPGSPWSLLLLIGPPEKQQSDGLKWLIQIRMQQAGSEQVGFDVAIRFDRPYPGPVPPFVDPGPRPTMDKAGAYLVNQ